MIQNPRSGVLAVYYLKPHLDPRFLPLCHYQLVGKQLSLGETLF